ncbi:MULTISPECIES: 50S ribosomal protein L10 [Aminiphilus]|jgi:large subunit ribosomal protein L10|uniref:50S ribosomal protein L10 n=1 Tax=Aminiphilus TaxID=290731 RepID=UPI000492694C|nr:MULTISPECIES: 50S ribosomal protein L10 [Aminiphilus]
MPTEARMQQVSMLRELLQRSEAVFIVEYRGMNVKKMTAVRAKVREAGGEMKIAKNTLFRIALAEENSPVPEEMTAGANAFTMAYGDVTAVAKALRDFSKEKGNEMLIIKGGIMGQHVLDQQQVLALADLPSREVLLAQVVGTIAAPLRSLVTVLSGPMRGFVTCLSQIKDEKEKAA